MGQYTLLAVLAALVLGGVVLFNVQQKAQVADDDLSEYHETQFSREVALVGLKRTERLLADEPDDWDLFASDPTAAQALYGASATTYTKGAFTGSFEVAYDGFTDKTADTPALAFVTATGEYGGKRYVVRAVYEQGETDIGLPPSMRDAIVSDNRLYINGNVEVSGGVHTNNCLDTNGNSFDVYGQGTYTGCEGANDARFTGGLAQMDSIAVPPVVLPTTFDHATAAPQAVTIGAQTVDLTTTGIAATLSSSGASVFTVTGAGVQADPYVLRVNGNLTLDGDIRLTGAGGQGHIRIYASGNIFINGNTQIAPVTGALPNQFSTIEQTNTWRETNMTEGGTIGIYSMGDIRMTGNATVVAHLFANGTVRYHGGGHRIVIGGMTTQGDLDVRGNAQVVYTDANSSVIDPGSVYQTPDGVRLAAYREWATR